MSNREIFTPEELNENLDRKRELKELVASRDAVLMVGAGSSVRVGYVNWPELLKQLEELACRCCGGFPANHNKRANDPLGYAADIKTYMEKIGFLTRYYAKLCELFESKTRQYNEFHKALISLPFRGILTTNYDPVLDAALSASETEFPTDSPLVVGTSPPRLIHDFLIRMVDDRRIPRRVAHLHGKYDLPESIVLGSEDYSKAYGIELRENESGRPPQSSWTLHRKLLWAILATRRVLFLGFSMDDPYFNKMLEFVSSDLWGWDKVTHFTISSISLENAEDSKAKASRLRSKYGVGTVFYELVENSHAGLDHIVSELVKECAVEAQSASTPQDAGEYSDAIDSEERRPDGSESEDNLDWLSHANETMLKRIENED